MFSDREFGECEIRSHGLELPELGCMIRVAVLALAVALTTSLGISSSRAQNAYIANSIDGTVTVIATPSNTVTGSPVTVGRGPAGVAVTPNGSTVYVANETGNTVSVIATSTNAVTATVPVGLSPFGVAVTPDGSKVYVTNYNSGGTGSVSVIATSTNTVTATVPGVISPVGVAVTPNGSAVYVANLFNSSTVSVIDTTTNTVTATISDPSLHDPFGLTITPDGSKVYVTNYNGGGIGSVSVIDVATNKVAATITVDIGRAPQGIAVSPDGGKVYVANGNSNSVSVIATSSNTVIDTIFAPSFQGPLGLAVTPDGSEVYVVNEAGKSGTVSVIATSTNTVTNTTLVGNGPIAFGNFVGPALPAQTLTVQETGNGLVTSSPAGINCSASSNACAASFAGTTTVTLTASATGGSIFTGWSDGGCGGTGACVIDLTANTTVSAAFVVAPSFLLSVTAGGTGLGTVTSTPSGINCGPVCSASYQSGSQVVLNAAPGAGSAFAGWSGSGCSGMASCTVTMNAAESVSATFTAVVETLTVAEVGGGAGQVTSSPSGINCSANNSQCAALFAVGSQITLTAAAAGDSSFAGWSGGGCSGIDPCTVTLGANTTVNASFVADTAGNLTLVAAVLPLSRSVELGATPTAFATIINAGPDNASTCTIAPTTGIPASFLFQTTDPTTNAVTGTANTPVNISAGQAQSFVMAFTPTAAFPPTSVAFAFTCANAPSAAATNVGVDTLSVSASTTPVPDIVALAASGDPGYVDIPGAAGTGVFAVAIVNLGIDATITAAANTGTTDLPVTLTICQTNPTSGACLAPPAPSATTDIQPNATPTFGIFVTGSAAVADSPGVNRVFVTFTDSGGTLRGETSVAVRTQ
jgi:YVTN family beta-propeller protein